MVVNLLARPGTTISLPAKHAFIPMSATSLAYIIMLDGMRRVEP